jgi:hypothetical protein
MKGYLGKGIQLPWREAGPPEHYNDEVDSDQYTVKKEASRLSRQGGKRGDVAHCVAGYLARKKTRPLRTLP